MSRGTYIVAMLHIDSDRVDSIAYESENAVAVENWATWAVNTAKGTHTAMVYWITPREEYILCYEVHYPLHKKFIDMLHKLWHYLKGRYDAAKRAGKESPDF